MSDSSFAQAWRMLAKPNIRTIFVSYLITYLGTSMAPIAMAFGVLELTGSTKDTAVVMAASTISTLIVLFIGGAIADRTSRKKVIVFSELVAMGVQLCVAWLFLSGNAEVWSLSLMALISGAAMALNGPAAVGLIPDLVDKDELQQTNAVLGMARNGAMIAGAALGGLLVAWVGAGITLLIDALSFGLSALLIWQLKPKEQSKPEKASIITDLKLGWREFISHTWLWVIVIQFAFVVGAFHSVMAVVGPAMSNTFYGGPKDWGLVMSALSVGLVVGGVIGFKIKPKHPLRLATFCVFAYSLIPLALAFKLPLFWVGLAAFVDGVAGEIFVVFWVLTLQQKIPAHLLSRVSAYDYIGSLSLTPIAIIVVGWLYETLEPSTVLLLISAAIILPTVLTLLVKDVWHMQAEPEAQQEHQGEQENVSQPDTQSEPAG